MGSFFPRSPVVEKERMNATMSNFKGTTIVAVQKGGKTAIAGDGQVTMGETTIMKHGAKKVRRLYNDQVVVGFAGSVADAFSLCEKFESCLEQYAGNMPRAAVELAQTWRMDTAMRTLEAMLLAAEKESLLLISGTGEVIAPDDGVLAIGSGGNYALAAARAMVRNTELEPKEIVRKALEIASEICVYTNDHISVEEV